MNNIRFLYYTNENNQGLVELNLKRFFMINKNIDLKITILSNKFNNPNFQHKDNVTYLSSEVSLSDPNRFVKTMEYGLLNTEEEYVFFILDDYFMIREIKYENIVTLLKIMDCDNIDSFSFDTLYLTTGNEYTSWKKFTSKCHSDFDDHLIYRPNEYEFLYSIQPTIWKKESFLKIFQNCGNFSFRELDKTINIIKEKTSNYKNLSTTTYSLFDYNNDINMLDNYFAIAYTEVVRHGVFMIPENGNPGDTISVANRFIYQLIKEENLELNPEFDILLSWYKYRDKNLEISSTTSAWEVWLPVEKKLNLIKDLKERELWCDDLEKEITLKDKSLEDIIGIPSDLKEKYK